MHVSPGCRRRSAPRSPWRRHDLAARADVVAAARPGAAFRTGHPCRGRGPRRGRCRGHARRGGGRSGACAARVDRRVRVRRQHRARRAAARDDLPRHRARRGRSCSGRSSWRSSRRSRCSRCCSCRSRSACASSTRGRIRPRRPLGEEMRHVLEHQRAWNNVAFFLVRSVVYLASWSGVALALVAPSARTDVTRARDGRGLLRLRAHQRRREPCSSAFTLTFAAFDWLMAARARVGVEHVRPLLLRGRAVRGDRAADPGGARRATGGAFPEAVGASHLHALGRLLLMSVILWAYIALLPAHADLDRQPPARGRRSTRRGRTVAPGV